MERLSRNRKKQAASIIFWILMPVLLLSTWADHLFTRQQRIWVAWFCFLGYIIVLVLHLLGVYEEKKTRISDTR